MGQSVRWCVLVCATMGMFSMLGTPVALGQQALPRQNQAVAPWFIPLAESVDGIVNGRTLGETNGSGQTAGGVICNVSAVLGASPTASVAYGAKGRVNDREDGFVNWTGAEDYYTYHEVDHPDGVFGGWQGPKSVLYRWFVSTVAADEDKYGAMVANLQGQDTLVMTAVVANISSTVVSKLQAGTLSAEAYADLLQGVTADFYSQDPSPANAKLFSASYAKADVFPTSATGVSLHARDATLVVFLWDGSQTDNNPGVPGAAPFDLVLNASARTTTASGLRALVQLVGGQNIYSNYVGIDQDGPALGPALDTSLGSIVISSVADVYGNPVPGMVRQTGFVSNASSEIRWGDLITVDASIDVNKEKDGEPDAYFATGGSDILGRDAYGERLALKAGLVGYTTRVTPGNIGAAILRTPNYPDDKKGWTTTLAEMGVHAGYANAIFPGDEGGIWYGTVESGVARDATSANWLADPIILRYMFVVRNTLTSGGNDQMPVNLLLGDELGLHHENKHTIGGVEFNAAAIAEASNSLNAALTGYVDNRPPQVVRAVLTPEAAFRVVGSASQVDVRIDFGIEEEPLDRLKHFSITVDPADFSAAAFVVDSSQIASVVDLQGNPIIGAQGSGSFMTGVTSLANAGVVVTVTDDARLFSALDSKIDGETRVIAGIAGPVRPSTLVLDTQPAVIRSATLYAYKNIVGARSVGNGEIIGVLDDAGYGAPDAGAAIIGATIGSPGSKIRLQVDIAPSAGTPAEDVDLWLAQYPDTPADGDKAYRQLLGFSRGSGNNVLGVNAGGLFGVNAIIPKVGMTWSSFSVIEAATLGARTPGLVSVVLEGTIPDISDWPTVGGVDWAQVGSATGIGFVLAEIDVNDFANNLDSADAADHAFSTGMIIDTTMPLVLEEVAPLDIRAVSGVVATYDLEHLFFAVVEEGDIPSAIEPQFDSMLGLNTELRRICISAPGVKTFTVPYDVPLLGRILPLEAGDVVIVEATISGVPATLRTNDPVPASLPMLWPSHTVAGFPGIGAPKLISADFSDFIDSATAVLPLASRTLNSSFVPYGAGDPRAKIANAQSDDILLVTFGLRITGTDLNRSLGSRNVRSVTVNVWDVAGNVSAVGISGATANFGAPDIDIISFKVNGGEASTVLPNATASTGGTLQVVVEVDPADSGRITQISANFGQFGLAPVVGHTADDEYLGYYEGVATSSWGRRVDGTYGPISITADPMWPADSRIGMASIVYATFTYSDIEDNGLARADRNYSVVITATNEFNVPGVKSTSKIGVDLNEPRVREVGGVAQAFMKQIAPTRSPGDSLTDELIRPGDVLRVTAAIEIDDADAAYGNVVTTKSVTPELDFSDLGGVELRRAENIKYDASHAFGRTLFATWTVEVGSGVGDGTTGPWDVEVVSTDAVGNVGTQMTNEDDIEYLIENGKPLFSAADIAISATNDVNWTGGISMANMGHDPNVFYALPARRNTDSILGIDIGMDTVKAKDAIRVNVDIALNDDPNKVQIETNKILLDFGEFNPAIVAQQPNQGRVGAQVIKATWAVIVSADAPSTFGAGAGSRVAITAEDTAGLSSGAVVDDVTVEVDNTFPDAVMDFHIYNPNGDELLGPIISGRSVSVGDATLTAKLRVTYKDGGDDNASDASKSVLKDLPGLVIGAQGNPGAMTLLGADDFGAGYVVADFFTMEGGGDTVTSASSNAEILNSTNRILTYYFLNADPSEDLLKLQRGKQIRDLNHSGIEVSGTADSKAIAWLIGFAGDDIGNITPTEAVIGAVGPAQRRSAVYGVELDNDAPEFARTLSVGGEVVRASMMVVSGPDLAYEPLQPAVHGGDIVEVSFAIRDPENDTKPLKVAFDMRNFIPADEDGVFTDISIDNTDSPVATWYKNAGLFEISNITPVDADTPAQGTFRFTVHEDAPTTDTVAYRADPTEARDLGNLVGARILMEATDNINIDYDVVGASFVRSSTIEVDNEPAVYMSTNTGLPAIMIDGSNNSNAQVHVKALQPDLGHTDFRFLEPPSVTSISSDPANPTLIRASATIYTDTFVSFDTNLVSVFNSDGRTRVAWYEPPINATETAPAKSAVQLGPTQWVLNATARVLPNADPIQPQTVTMTAYDQVGNAGESSSANVLAINAQGVVMLDSLLYINGTEVSQRLPVANTPASAADRLLVGAGMDELRPGDVVGFVAVLSHDVGTPDYITADFTDFYSPARAASVQSLVPSATQAGAGNTTIATWTIATVDVQPWAVNPQPMFTNLLWNQFLPGVPGDATPLFEDVARQGLRPVDFAANQISTDPSRAAMANVLGSPNIAVQQVWNIGAGTGVRPAKAAEIIVTATDVDSLFPPSSLPSAEVIVDTQPPDVIVRLDPAVPFKNHPDDPPNRVTAGDQVDLAIRLMNADVDGAGDDHWWPTAPGEINADDPAVFVDVSDLGILGPQPLAASALADPVTATIYEAEDQYTVGSNVGNSDVAQQQIVNIVISASDDVGNDAVEIIHEQPIAVDNWPPSIYAGSLGVRLLSGTAVTAAGIQIPEGNIIRSGASISPGAILRVSAVVGDTLDDPLTFLSSDRISLNSYGIPAASVILVTEIAQISRDNLFAPFVLTLPPAEELDTTIGFGFTVSVTDSMGNADQEESTARFNINGRPVFSSLASTSDGLLADTPVADGGTVVMNADSILTLLVEAMDLGAVTAIDVTWDPADPVGLTVGGETSDLGASTVTTTLTVTPEAPLYGVAPPGDLLVQGSATDDDNLVATLSGIIVDVNAPALFASTFTGTADSETADAASEDVVLSPAGADVREVTVTEGSLLTLLLEAMDTAAPSTITLEATGTAISSSAVIAGVTLAGESVLNATTTPTASIDAAGTVTLEFEPGYEAIPYGAGVDLVTFALRASVADSLQVNKDWVDVIINVIPKAEAPIVAITDVTVVNADGTSISLGAVAEAVVQETSSVVITASAYDLGGEPVTLTFASDTALTGDFTASDPTAGAATVGELEVITSLDHADFAPTGLDTDTDPTTITFSGTNASGREGTAAVTLDLLNLSQAPILTMTATVNGVDVGTVENELTVDPGDIVVLNITATDSDGELVILAASGLSGELETEPPLQGLIVGTYTFAIPADLTADLIETVTITATDGGFKRTTRTITVTIIAGEHAPVLTISPAEATVGVGESVVITLSATDIDGDAVTFSQSPEIGLLGTPTQVDDVTTVDLTVTGVEIGILTSEITASDGVLTDTGTLTVTVTPPAAPDQIVMAQGYGGSTLVKIVSGIDFSRITGFPGIPARFADNVLDPPADDGSGDWLRLRAVNPAVADVDDDGVPDVILGFGLTGEGSAYPSVLLVWSVAGDTRAVIASKNMFWTDPAKAEVLWNPLGALNVAAGDFLGEGSMILAAQGRGGSNMLRVAQPVVPEGGGLRLNIIGTFEGLSGFAKNTNTAGGVSVAAGDVDGDGLDEIIVGQMTSDRARSTMFQILDIMRDEAGNVITRRTPADTSLAFEGLPEAYRGLGGVNLAIGDLDGDGQTNEIIVGTAGDPDGVRGNTDLKNFIRVFRVSVNERHRITAVEAITPPIQAFGGAQNPSGAIGVAAANLDADDADEVLVSTQANITLVDGAVVVTEPAPRTLMKGMNVEFDETGAYTGSSRATPNVGGAPPTSGAVNVQAYR